MRVIVLAEWWCGGLPWMVWWMSIWMWSVWVIDCMSGKSFNKNWNERWMYIYRSLELWYSVIQRSCSENFFWTRPKLFCDRRCSNKVYILCLTCISVQWKLDYSVMTGPSSFRITKNPDNRSLISCTCIRALYVVYYFTAYKSCFGVRTQRDSL